MPQTHLSPERARSLINDPAEDEPRWSLDENADDDEHEHNPRARKRSRRSGPVSTSCERCKDRKVKCDRGLPVCLRCSRSKQTCEYKERKKPGLRAGYGRQLESRLDRLEGSLQSQQQYLQQLVSHLPNTLLREAQNLAPVELQHVPLAEPQFFMQTADESLHQGVANTAGHVQVPSPGHSSTQGSHGREYGPLRSPNLRAGSLSIARDLPRLTGPTVELPGRTSPMFTVNEVTKSNEFPPVSLAYALTDLFFTHINTWCPILHRRTTLDSLFGPNILEDADRILLHAIIATTLRFSTDARLSQQSRDRYYAVSKQKVLLHCIENSSVKALQSLVILALDTVGTSNGPPGWNLLALMSRIVVQLGLVVETTSASVAPLFPSIYTLRAMILPEPKSFIEDESRRRLFWMVYILDRHATISTAFDFALDEKEIDRKLPCRDDLLSQNHPVDTRYFRSVDRTDYNVDKPENLGSFSYYVEIVGILSDIHRFLRKPVDIGALSDVEAWQKEYRQLDSELSSWKSSLPKEYGNMSQIYQSNNGRAIVDCAWIMLHVTFHTALIRLHSSAAYPTTRSPIFTPSFSASKRCYSAAVDICALCTYVRKKNMLTKLGPTFAFSLWVAARLLLVHGSTIDHHVNPIIHSLVETLNEIGVYWKVAERYATLLLRVLEEYSASEHAPIDPSARRETPSSVQILADMRRTAYDLDLLISRQPRHDVAARTNLVTSARIPTSSELECLDLFDFFNQPRLPFSAISDSVAVGVFGDSSSGCQPTAGNEFNMTNFVHEANADWFTIEDPVRPDEA